MNVGTEMPLYKCHKTVHALKIAEIRDPTEPGHESGGSMVLVPKESRYVPFLVPAEFIRKHSPQPGGYYVVYADGYKSYSPARPFEAGYTRI